FGGALFCGSLCRHALRRGTPLRQSFLLPLLGRRALLALAGLPALRFRGLGHGGGSKELAADPVLRHRLPGLGPAMTSRSDRYQPRAASASQPKTLNTSGLRSRL